MKRCFYVAVALLGLSVLSSCTRTVYVPVQPHSSERVVLHDTIIEVHTQGETQHRTTVDTVSVLRTDRAYSVAAIERGTLSHSLSVLPRCDSVKLQLREVHRVDSVPYLVAMPGERVEVVPAWVWCVVALFALSIVLVFYLLAKLYLR